jgi:hypothetical protein
MPKSWMMLKLHEWSQKSDLKMSSLNVRTTYHIYYFMFKLYFFVIHFFVTFIIEFQNMLLFLKSIHIAY